MSQGGRVQIRRQPGRRRQIGNLLPRGRCWLEFEPLVLLSGCRNAARQGHSLEGGIKPIQGNRAAGDLAFYGYLNTRQVLNWVAANFGSTQLTSLVVTGSSAGAVGAVIWASTIMGELKHTKSTVLADSYVGTFPTGRFIGKIIKENWNACSTGLFTGSIQTMCSNGEVTADAVYADTIKRHPATSFGFVTSKSDIVQWAFYNIIALDGGLASEFNPQEFYKKQVQTMRKYAKFHNTHFYVLRGTEHVYFNSQVFGQIDAKADFHFPFASATDALVNWVRQFRTSAVPRLPTICDGHIVADVGTFDECDLELSNHHTTALE